MKDWSAKEYEAIDSVSTLFHHLQSCKARWKYPQMRRYTVIPIFHLFCIRIIDNREKKMVH